MTPAIKILQKNKIEFTLREYSTEADVSSYGIQAAEALKQDPSRVFKTLLAMIEGNNKPVVAIVPVSTQLDLKKLASHFKARRASMADADVAQRVTGYLVGGISPLGQKQKLKICVDLAAQDFETIFVSGGKRGLQLELKPSDLINVVGASTARVSK